MEGRAGKEILTITDDQMKDYAAIVRFRRPDGTEEEVGVSGRMADEEGMRKVAIEFLEKHVGKLESTRIADYAEYERVQFAQGKTVQEFEPGLGLELVDVDIYDAGKNSFGFVPQK